ncbi:hypothetical protein HPB48_013320 [Haemaphysalis longicornis]|uniref:Uncharacterized protein n=1 Tax=Haemaphysalis longicornis TaxID=44386 RepID=A0A9J6GQ32_HAELO|nr:hypothetical protein HPB48_013320 [Haemaphysalis longicornis]
MLLLSLVPQLAVNFLGTGKLSLNVLFFFLHALLPARDREFEEEFDCYSYVPRHNMANSAQPKVALASKLSVTANRIAGTNRTTPVPIGVTPNAAQVSASTDQGVASGSPFPVSASQSSSVASLPPQLPAALAAHLPVQLGGLLQAPLKPGTKYVVVQTQSGQALNLDALLALPELRGSKETVIIQSTAPTQPQAAECEALLKYYLHESYAEIQTTQSSS